MMCALFKVRVREAQDARAVLFEWRRRVSVQAQVLERRRRAEGGRGLVVERGWCSSNRLEQIRREYAASGIRVDLAGSECGSGSGNGALCTTRSGERKWRFVYDENLAAAAAVASEGASAAVGGRGRAGSGNSTSGGGGASMTMKEKIEAARASGATAGSGAGGFNPKSRRKRK